MLINYSTSSSIGKTKRMNRLFSTNDRCIIVPLDDNLISGDEIGLHNLRNKIKHIENAKPNAVLGYYGSLELMKDTTIPTILNLTASTVRSTHNNKIHITNIERALALGVDAVAAHINVSSKYESEMIKNIGFISEKCDRYGMPLMILAYPRTEGKSEHGEIDENYLSDKESNNDNYVKLVSHCVRIAVELGADIIKTHYTGKPEMFNRVIESANGKPVLIAGGQMVSSLELFTMVKNSIEAGASGICIGRNVFNATNTTKTICALKKIVYSNESINKAMGLLNN